MVNISIRPETKSDYRNIDTMVKESFAKGTPYSNGTSEVELIHEVRNAKYYIPALAFVALLNERIVGHFMFSYLPLATDVHGTYDQLSVKSDIVMLTPVAVKWGFQRQGIGKSMLTQGIEQVKNFSDIKGIMVEGNPGFYHTVGFKSSYEFGIYPVKAIELPAPECMMLQELQEGSLNGISGFINYSMYKNA